MDQSFADQPEHLALVNELLEQIDAASLARQMNEITGGSLLERDALNVARMVGLAALRNAGRAIVVAGLAGQVKDGGLRTWLVTPVAEIKLPDAEPKEEAI